MLCYIHTKWIMKKKQNNDIQYGALRGDPVEGVAQAVPERGGDFPPYKTHLDPSQTHKRKLVPLHPVKRWKIHLNPL